MTDHQTVLLSRPMVEGRPRYQVQCSCGRKTEIGSRQLVQQEQKNHRKEARRNEHGQASVAPFRASGG